METADERQADSAAGVALTDEDVEAVERELVRRGLAVVIDPSARTWSGVVELAEEDDAL